MSKFIKFSDNSHQIIDQSQAPALDRDFLSDMQNDSLVISTSTKLDGLVVWESKNRGIYNHFKEEKFFPGAQTLSNSSIKSGYLIAAHTEKAQLVLWRWDSNEPYARFSTRDQLVKCVEMFMDGRYCIAGSKAFFEINITSVERKNLDLGYLDWKHDCRFDCALRSSDLYQSELRWPGNSDVWKRLFGLRLALC